MKHQGFKSITAGFFTAFPLLVSKVAFADVSVLVNDARNQGITDIVTPMLRVLNVLVLSAGVFFVLYVVYAALKFASAQGDPKGAQGAKNTLTHAVIGFLIVIGSYTILSVLGFSLGATRNGLNTVEGASGQFKEALCAFVNGVLGFNDPGCP